MSAGPSRLRSYLKFLAWATAIVAGLMALGFLPTRNLAGAEGGSAMVAGCLISWIASVAGTIPLVLATDAQRRAQAALQATVIRFLLAGGLGVALALSGLFAPKPLVVWLGLSYAALLPIDALYAARWGREEKADG